MSWQKVALVPSSVSWTGKWDNASANDNKQGGVCKFYEYIRISRAWHSTGNTKKIKVSFGKSVLRHALDIPIYLYNCTNVVLVYFIGNQTSSIVHLNDAVAPRITKPNKTSYSVDWNFKHSFSPE